MFLAPAAQALMPKQFSLRLMMAVVTILCIALGVRVMPAERQRRAVKAIEAVRGKVRYEASESVLRPWLPRDYFDEVRFVHLTTGGPRLIFDEAQTMAHVATLNKLQSLLLVGSNFTDAGLVHLQGLTNLRVLSLEKTRVTKDGVARLQTTLPKCDIWLNGGLFRPKALAHRAE